MGQVCTRHYKLRRLYKNDLNSRRKHIQTLTEIVRQVKEIRRGDITVRRQNWLNKLEDDFEFYKGELKTVTDRLQFTAEQLGPAWEYALANKIKMTNPILPENLQFPTNEPNLSNGTMPKSAPVSIGSSTPLTTKEN